MCEPSLHADYLSNSVSSYTISPYNEEMLITGSLSNEIKEDVKENRFSAGKVCPHCKSE